MNGDSDARTSNPKDVPLRRTVLDGIKDRHAAVDASHDPVATAKDMAYLSHLDRRDLLDEIERLTRERDEARATVQLTETVTARMERLARGRIEAERDRLRTALGELAADASDSGCLACDRTVRKVRKALSGDPNSAPETSGEPRYSQAFVLELLGYLTGAIPELHAFESGKMIALLEEFEQRKAKA